MLCSLEGKKNTVRVRRRNVRVIKDITRQLEEFGIIPYYSSQEAGRTELTNEPIVAINLKSIPSGRNTSCHIRIPLGQNTDGLRKTTRVPD